MAKPVQVRRCRATVTGEVSLPEARTTASVTLHCYLAEWVREPGVALVDHHLSPFPLCHEGS
jgi:hypothetical protein